MGNIKTYPLDAIITGSEKLLGSDIDGTTVNFTLDQVVAYGLSGGGGGGTDDQTATEVPFTPYLTVTSTDVQSAIAELKDELDLSGGGNGDMILASPQTSTGKKTFLSNATTAGLNFGSVTVNPSALVAGDSWFRSDTEVFGIYDGSSIRSFVTDTDAQSLTNKTLPLGSNTVSGTKAEFDTAVTDGNIMYIGDAPTAHTHTLSEGATDVTATATELNLLDLSGLTAGWVLSADTSTTASWKAQVDGVPVSDSIPLVKGSVTDTKLVRIEADTNVPIATTVVLSAPSSDLDMENLIVSEGTGRTNAVKISDIWGQTQADFNTDGAADSDQLVVITDAKSYEYVQVACSDMTTAITTGTDKAFAVSPVTGTITNVYAYLFDAGTVTGLTVDINKNGTTILSTKLTTDATEQTSRTAAAGVVISVSAISAGDRLTFDFDAVPTAGKGVIVELEIEKS